MELPAGQFVNTIFFDLGFTLINFSGDFYQVLRDSYLAMAVSLSGSGFPLDNEKFSERFDHEVSAYYRSREIDLIERSIEGILLQVIAEFGHPTPDKKIVQSALVEMYRVTQSYWQAEDDALQTLENLKTAGYRLGLITNAANAWDVNQLIDKFGFRRYFEVILISAEEKIRKPDVRIYLRAMDLMGVKPHQTVMVGDTLTADVLGAHNVGMHAVWLRRRADRPENHVSLDSVTPDAAIDSLSELIAILPSLEKAIPG